uniref:RNA binding motif protein 25b n=1 Tax=Hucho hucho TaxID=62062 RepID=A0A4W5MPM9_9TELE
MSFPPHLNRTLLPPGIPPPQFAGFPSGTPMIPVHMGIMTQPPAVLVPTSMPAAPRKEASLVKAKETDENSGPTTTVFVGNISEKASDMLIRQLLAKCGLVLSWKRVQGASGKLQGKNRTAFGFCEYKEPESTLRALRLLHELQIGVKKLLVKVDAKTKAQLDEFKAKKKSSTNGNGEKAEGGKEEEEEEEEEEVIDEDTKRRDQAVKGAIDGLIREYASELNAASNDESPHRRKKKEKKEEEDINAIDGLEDDKRDLISREISKFRDTHKKLEEEKDKKEKERAEFDRERRERDKERERERERRDREREKEREKERERERERDRERDRSDRDRDRDRNRTKEREREWERERSHDRSKDRSHSREVSRDRDKDKKRDQEDEEEVYERRRLERKLRDKEAAYQERLKNWEIRERKKARDYSKESDREEERRREMTKESKRLKEFLEDYDDDRDDPKYYRGSALQKRLRDREKETEVDERDRKREKEELEEIRQRLLAEGHPDPEAEIRRMEEVERLRQPPVKPEPDPEEERVQKAPRVDRDRRGDRDRGDRDRGDRERERGERDRGDRERERGERDRERGERDRERDRGDHHVPQHHHPHSDDEGEEEFDDDYQSGSKPCLKSTLRPITAAPSVSSASGGATPNTPCGGDESPCGIIIPHENSPPHETPPQEEFRPKIGLSLKLGATSSPSQPNVAIKRKKLTVDSVFNKFDDEEADEAPRKRKLVPLDYGDDDKNLQSVVDGASGLAAIKGANTEEKRKHIKSLIEKIPTGKTELFSYPLDWSAVDPTLMDQRIRPWINKKIIEYIGEEEATLVDFVCSKVMAHGTPQGILDDVAMVLDEEAEVFIVKMWRLLIYETEAKKIGLVK